MTADMIIKFFENYGWVMTVLATSGIFLVGCLKASGIFSKLKPEVKKYVYFGCSCVVSVVACTVYLCVNNAFVWADWGLTAVCIICYTMAIYGLYENTGVRTLLKKVLFTPIKTLRKNLMSLIVSKNLSEEKMILLAKNLGSDILIQLANEVHENDTTKQTNQDIGKSVKSEETNSDLDNNDTGTECHRGVINNNFFG